MNFDKLKQYAKELRKEGYKISGISKLVDNSEDRKLLRKLLNDAVLEQEEEEVEIKKVDIEKTIANVISNEKKIGGLAKVEKAVLKCFGLLS
jgi:transcription antitermination factor NusA-like protein